MKRIEDAPKEFQKMFADVWEQVVCSASGISDYRDEVEHAFLKGFDVAMATGGLPQKPKRTIEHVYANDKSVFVLSNDKKVFALRITPEGFQWVKQPDLPQDET